MSLKLLDHVSGSVDAACRKNCFDLWLAFASDAPNLIHHNEFRVYQGTEHFENVALAVSSMQNAKVLFQRVESYTVSAAPYMDMALQIPQLI